jgi:hypothetical protein
MAADVGVGRVIRQYLMRQFADPTRCAVPSVGLRGDWPIASKDFIVVTS